MNPVKHRKAAETIVEVLKNRSSKALEFARKTLLGKKEIQGVLRDALKYYVLDWKDYTHPGLFSLACEAVHGDLDKTIEVQAVTAMMAAALDIHDDIVDMSKAKHGKLTVFGKYGQGTSLILGDVFLVSSLTLLGEASTRLYERNAIELLGAYRKLLLELGSAHALELDLRRKKSIVPEQYMRVLQMKAASCEADMRLGAIAGEGTDVEIDTLAKYGRIVGTLVVLREEFIDLFEIEELSHRIRKECLPIPLLYSLQNEESKTRLRKLLAKPRLSRIDVDELLDTVFKAKAVKRLKRSMKLLVRESVSLTLEIPDREVKRTLRNLPASLMEDL
jgi:geranylgeranyl pyrophosphate synthase